MPIVNYVREHTRFMEYATDEHLTPSERLLWYALMHIMNQRAKGNDWPGEFIRISNDRLLSYCPMKYDTIAAARNGLKQRGLIDYQKGDKNKLSPAYRMIYFSPEESNPEISDNMGGNIGDNMGGNIGDNMGGNIGDININNTEMDTLPERKPGGIHTQDNVYWEHYTQARAHGYIGPDGLQRPARYDSAWMTSPKARGAVAQRIINGFPFQTETGTALHDRLVELMKYGMPPETIEDIGKRANSSSQCTAALLMFAENMGFTEAAYEWRRCLKVAGGNEEFARKLYKISQGGQEE